LSACPLSTILLGMPSTIHAPLQPDRRLLCGPGPSNVDQRVLDAMQKPMLGHLDPDMHEILLEVVDLLRAVYRAPEHLVFPLQATGTSGMETGIVNLLEPGDTAIVGTCGFFGRRIADMAERAGAKVVRVDADWGEVVSNDALLDALHRHPEARLLAVVHAETSTGARHPVAELGAALRDTGTLFMVDCVTSLGGVELEVGAWSIDFAYSCTQKCLAAPPGMSPIAVSPRAMERVAARRAPMPFSFDLQLLRDYWVERPAVYHNTIPILHVYALHEALRLVLEEGLEARWARHDEAGAHLQRRIRNRGFELLADPEHQLAPLTAVRVPEDVDGKRVQQRMLRHHGIEIGGGLGPAAPPMWRLGLMGSNATIETADRLVAGLDAVLAHEPGLLSAV
jgi:alanine-glyoxylate transaminase/serine-glyoxylate transaminase/serine-pyruvate transaminase